MASISKYTHSPTPHLNGPVQGIPQPGNVGFVPPQTGLKGTNVGGNVFTRFIGNLLNRQ